MPTKFLTLGLTVFPVVSLQAAAQAQNLPPAPESAPSSTASTAAPATTNPSAPPSAGPSTAPVTTPSGTTATAAATPQPIKIGGFTVSGSIRGRYENWNWFDTPGFDDSYGFEGVLGRVAIARNSKKLDVLGELAVPALFNLPDNAIAPAPRGQLGLGANYRAASRTQDASIFPKQGFARFKFGQGNTTGLRLGRFEFWDGSEATPKNPTLAALKRDRINHRLLGNFGFSHVGRSFDGAQLSATRSGGVFNLMAMRPTEGVFQLNGLGEVNGVDIAYASFTRPAKTSEYRVLAAYYRDDRSAPLSVKVDNRPAAARTADRQDISVATLGGHYIKTLGAADLLAWGALQGGDWGNLSHRAGAFALEAGYQPTNRKLSKLRPWLRVGLNKSSGDGDATDGDHETFFPMVYTPRIYARTPIYNSMNNDDLFASLILRPNPKLSARLDARRIRLSDSRDLWYSGGGAFQDQSFGYAGRPSGGSKNLGNLLDISLDYNVSPQSAVGLYFGHFAGGRVIKNIYADNSLNYAYLELTQKF